MWIGGSLTITCIAAVQVFFNHGANVSTPVWFIIALAFVWLSILAAIMSFSKAKWLPTAGAFAWFIVLGVFTLSVIIFAFKHGAHGLDASGYKLSEGGFVLLVGVLLFNFVGFELPSSAGEEMTNPQRDVPFGIARSAVASVVLYALPVLGILIVLPTSAITNFSGFVSAIQDVFTVYELQRGARRDHLHHADQLPAHLSRAVEAAAQPPGHAAAVQDALAPAAHRDPDAPGGRGQHPAHRPRAGQLVVRQ